MWAYPLAVFRIRENVCRVRASQAGTVLHHAAHAAHVGHTAWGASARFGRRVGNHGFGRDQQTRDRCCVFQRGTDNLSGVQHAEGKQVTVFFGLGVEPERAVGAFAHFASHDRPVHAGVLGDLAQRSFQCTAHDGEARILVGVRTRQAFKRFRTLNQGHAATHNNTFLHSSTGCVQRVVDTVLTLFHFHFGHAAHADDSHTACKLGHTFLQLLAVVLAVCAVDLATNLFGSSADVALLAATFHDDRLVRVNADGLGLSQVRQLDILELDAEDLEKLEMRALLGVALGSVRPARVAVMGPAGKEYVYKNEVKAARRKFSEDLAAGRDEADAKADLDKILAELGLRYERELMNPKEALSLGSISQVVMPSDTRRILAENLNYLMRHYKPGPMTEVQREFF